MESLKNIKNNDFSIIFNEVEKYHQKDSSIQDNLVREDDLKLDESIREFGNICNEINSIESNTTVFLTFS